MSEQTNQSWGGRFNEPTDEFVKIFGASVFFDKILAPYDIVGSIAHATMLQEVGLLSEDEKTQIIDGLNQILSEIKSDKFEWSVALEDVHMNVESRLTQLIGNAGKKLHTGRSRNDQVATDMRLYIRKNCLLIIKLIIKLQIELSRKALKYFDLIMPGYTHMQIAQPITLGHHLLAYTEMLERDKNRFKDALKRINENPLGAAALAGTSFPIDRNMTTKALGFNKIMENSIDAVSARDFIIEPLGALLD